MWLAAHNRSARVTCNSQFSLVTKIAEVSWQLGHLYQVCIWPQHSIVGPFEPATFLFVQLTDPLCPPTSPEVAEPVLGTMTSECMPPGMEGQLPF